jgi:hypothetical protein
MAKKNLESKPKRLHKHTVSFNDNELKVIAYYVAKYKIKNKSKLYREAIIATILRKMEDDYPTLF